MPQCTLHMFLHNKYISQSRMLPAFKLMFCLWLYHDSVCVGFEKVIYICMRFVCVCVWLWLFAIVLKWRENTSMVHFITILLWLPVNRTYCLIYGVFIYCVSCRFCTTIYKLIKMFGNENQNVNFKHIIPTLNSDLRFMHQI